MKIQGQCKVGTALFGSRCKPPWGQDQLGVTAHLQQVVQEVELLLGLLLQGAHDAVQVGACQGSQQETR
jgi:hypothetical protein